MSHSSVYELLQNMEADNIIFAYQGEVNEALLEAVYAMMDNHLEQRKSASEFKKRFYHLLVESLQNVFHHQTPVSLQLNKSEFATSGFIIKSNGKDTYSIITGNYIFNSEVDNLKNKLDEVNKLSPEALRNQYRQSLSGNEFSEKGGAGLGIIELARKSGNKLNYEFNKVSNEYSFFCLTITFPYLESK